MTSVIYQEKEELVVSEDQPKATEEQYSGLWDAVDTEETNPWSHPELWSAPEATKFRFRTTVAMWKDALEGAGV